jgi:type VI protein secretion system component Hcp
MANDVYIKFGEGDLRGGPLKTPLPDIEGDSTDASHYWWCELRECGFDMETPQQEDDQGSQTGATQAASTFHAVTLRKRVDWASTQLFLKCCEAAMATDTKSTENQGQGRIDLVTVEVCRPVSGGQRIVLDDGTTVEVNKIPCVTVYYYGVRIIKYAIAISSPEPAESITFEFDKVKVKYLQTDPSTGKAVNSTGVSTDEMENHHPPDAASGGDSTAASAGTSGGGGSGSTGGDGAGGVGSPAPAVTPAAAGAPPAAPGSPPDPTVNVNFPGLWQGTGFGVLPN